MGLAATGIQLVQDAILLRHMPRLLHPVRPLIALLFQSLIAVADRLQGAESRRDNALVFMLIARKP
jgi:hypothetical protein